MIPKRTLLFSVVGVVFALIFAFLSSAGAPPRREETATAYLWRVGRDGALFFQHLYYHAVHRVSVGKGQADDPLVQSLPQSGEPQDALKHHVAVDEHEIRQQQEVMVNRQKEAMKSQIAHSKAEDFLVLSEQPDEIRERMPAVSPDGPEMRCGSPIGSTSALTTRSIEIRIETIFYGGPPYTWKYIVTLKNHGQETMQMLTRHWLFVDQNGELESEVKGPGARGVTPVLPPGGEWSYESGTNLMTPYGSMHGSFQLEVLQGDVSTVWRSFSARVARVLLTSETSSAPMVMPCYLPSEDHSLLPLTSVLSTERIIVGGDTEVMPAEGGSAEKGYTFGYDVQINNARDDVVEIVGHSWAIVDAWGSRHVAADGPGVGGKFGARSYTLQAGDALRVQGLLQANTSEANAEGTFRVILKDHRGLFREIEARSDWMGLSAIPSRTHVQNYVADQRFW